MANAWIGKIQSIVLFFLMLTSMAVSQQIIVNSNGDRIVMYPNGSWRPAEPGDSALVRQYLQTRQANPEPPVIITISSERNEGETQDYLSRQWNELYGHIKAEEKNVQNDFRTATNAQFNAAERLRTAETNKKLMEPDQLEKLQDQFDHTVKTLKSVKLRKKDIEKLVEQGTKMNNNQSSLKQKKVNKLKSKFNIYLDHYDPGRTRPLEPPAENAPDQVQSPLPKTPVTNTQTSSSTKGNKSNAQLTSNTLPSSRKTKTYYTKAFDCITTTDTTDISSGRHRIELAPGIIFTYTDPDLRPFFKNKDLITCRGNLSKIGPYIYLNLNFQIASSHSQSNFGSLQNGSLLRLKLLNGEYVSLYNLKSDKGKIDPYSGNTLFSGQYALGKKELKFLEESGLDVMRVLWTTGYEDYEVYNIDFLINQIHCLLSKK